MGVHRDTFHLTDHPIRLKMLRMIPSRFFPNSKAHIHLRFRRFFAVAAVILGSGSFIHPTVYADDSFGDDSFENSKLPIYAGFLLGFAGGFTTDYSNGGLGLGANLGIQFSSLIDGGIEVDYQMTGSNTSLVSLTANANYQLAARLHLGVRAGVGIVGGSGWQAYTALGYGIMAPIFGVDAGYDFKLSEKLSIGPKGSLLFVGPVYVPSGATAANTFGLFECMGNLKYSF